MSSRASSNDFFQFGDKKNKVNLHLYHVPHDGATERLENSRQLGYTAHLPTFCSTALQNGRLLDW